jgi:hypothetical protein
VHKWLQEDRKNLPFLDNYRRCNVEMPIGRIVLLCQNRNQDIVSIIDNIGMLFHQELYFSLRSVGGSQLCWNTELEGVEE